MKNDVEVKHLIIAYKLLKKMIINIEYLHK